MAPSVERISFAEPARPRTCLLSLPSLLPLVICTRFPRFAPLSLDLSFLRYNMSLVSRSLSFLRYRTLALDNPNNDCSQENTPLTNLSLQAGPQPPSPQAPASRRKTPTKTGRRRHMSATAGRTASAAAPTNSPRSTRTWPSSSTRARGPAAAPRPP